MPFTLNLKAKQALHSVIICSYILAGCSIMGDMAYDVRVKQVEASESACKYTCDIKEIKFHHFGIYCKPEDTAEGLPSVFKTTTMPIAGKIEYQQDNTIIESYEIRDVEATGNPHRPSWNIKGVYPKSKGKLTIILKGDIAKLAKDRDITCHYIN